MALSFKYALPIILSFCITNTFAQAEHSTYTIKRTKNTGTQASRFVFSYFDPAGHPLKTGMVMAVNNDTICADPDTNGTFVYTVPKGLYQFSLMHQWLEIAHTRPLSLSHDSTVYVAVHFTPSVNKMPTILFGFGKPVIYLYPKQKTMVNVQLGFQGKLTLTYPRYEKGWTVIAQPDGQLTVNHNQYRYLFWEGEMNIDPNSIDWTKGFVVHTDSLLQFLENSLSLIGLTPAEQQDFITYWYPQMQRNTVNYIHFMLGHEYTSLAPLQVSPKPDATLRLFMTWCAFHSEQPLSLEKQVLPSFTRTGFTLVEWGGTEINPAFLQQIKPR